MKRLLYIYIGNFDDHSGVTNKLKGLFSSLNGSNVQYTLFSLSNKGLTTGFVSESNYFLPAALLSNEKEIYRELDKFILAQPAFDIYFFRYPLASYQLFMLSKKHKNKFVFEHNTKELPEIIEQGLFWVKKFNFRPTPSYAKLVFNTLVKPIFDEMYYRKKVLKNAKMGVAVTNEILDYEKKNCPGYICHTVSNGIDVKEVNFYKRELKKGDTLNLIMLANSGVNWHGVDLVINSFLKYTGKNIQLFFIGDFDEKVKQLAAGNSNIVFTGFLTSNEISSYFKIAHIGLGSFALFRKKLEEACTLKVREYWASGLPVLLGYKDSDIIESPVLEKFSLYKDIRIQQINWEEVYNWASNLYLLNDLNEQVLAEAYKTVDYKIKTKRLLDFINTAVA